MVYALADNLVDHYCLLLDQIENVLDELGGGLFSQYRHQQGEDTQPENSIYYVAQNGFSLREAIGRFSKSESHVIEESTRIFLRDLYDHTIQVMDTYRYLPRCDERLYDLYLSEISLR